jgi:hypothetical protein
LWLTTKGWKLQGIYLREAEHEGKLLALIFQAEETSTSNELEVRKDNLSSVDMGNENVACDFSNVLEERQVCLLVLDPGQLQVPIHDGTVRVAVLEGLKVTGAI